MRTPKWSRDELILALELYFRVNPIHASNEHPEIKKLSNTLNTLPIHPKNQNECDKKFRNPNGVYMKLCNFLRFDPNYRGTGLTRGGKLEAIIWEEFSHDRYRLKAVADSIRSAAPMLKSPSDLEEAAIDDAEFSEGRILTQLHKRRERNLSATKRKKKKVMQETGTLACEICGFDFYKVYGDLGRGFAECHHRLPLHESQQAKTIKLADLAIVCANCHRVLHRANPWQTVEQLKEVLRAKQGVRADG